VRLIVNDFVGHPGQVQLSRELARRGHDVEHQFCASFTTGTGAMTRCDGDPDTFSVRAMKLRIQFARY
jgi:colanic acid biosynthesis glycosyl transferase WcaI